MISEVVLVMAVHDATAYVGVSEAVAGSFLL